MTNTPRSSHVVVQRAKSEGVRAAWLSPKRVEQVRQRLAQGPATTAELSALFGLCSINIKRLASLAGASCVRGDRRRPLYHYLPEHEAQAQALSRQILVRQSSGQHDDLLLAYLAIGPLSLPMAMRALDCGHAAVYRAADRVADVIHRPATNSSGWVCYADRAHGEEGLWLMERELGSMHDPHGRRLGLVEALASGVWAWPDLARVGGKHNANLSRHLGVLRDRGLVVFEARPPSARITEPGRWSLTAEGRRVLAAHHEEVLVGLRPGVVPACLAAHPRVTAWGHLWDRVMYAMRGAPSPADLARNLGLHPVMASRLWTFALPHLPARLQAACILAQSAAPSCVQPETPPARPPAQPHTTKEPAHDLAPPAQDGDDLLQQPHQPAHPGALAPDPERHAEPDRADPLPLADAPTALGGEAPGGAALGSEQPPAPEAHPPRLAPSPCRELEGADPDPRDRAAPPGRGRGPGQEGRGGSSEGDRGASEPGPRPAELVSPATPPAPSPSLAPAASRTPERHIALQPPVPLNPNADVMRRLALVRRAQAERAALRVEAGGLSWTIRPVPAITGAWEIVESALDADKRIFGEDTARARLRRLAAQGKLPPRADGLTPPPPSRQEAHP